MCGITGFWLDRPLNSNDNNNLQSMLRAIEHRGPDSKGYHEDTSRGLMMGHDRLSIIDLHTGDQPIYSQDKNIVLTANGEIYDYKRLRSDLMSRGERFTTKSDSELIITLYQRHGLDFFKYLRGELAFTLYDARQDRLILARDRFGIRPLFFHKQGDSLFYGSEVKALLAHDQIRGEFDPKALLHQLMQTMVPGTSAYKDIHAVKPGHMLIAQRKNDRLELEQKRYWDAEFPLAQDYPTVWDEQEWIDKVRAKLIEAVTLRLEADVPVGCYLSGGIDSCSILGLATGAQQSPVKAFTISFDSGDYDESQIAVKMAHSMDADQDILRLSGNELYGNNYVRALWHAERTFYNTLGVAKWHMSRRVHESGFKVVVTGEGADELFGGYPFFKRDMFMHGMASDPGLQESLEQSNEIFRGAILSEKQVSHPAFDDIMGFTPSWIQTWMLTLDLARPLLHPDIREELEDYDPIEAIVATLDPDMLAGRHPLDKVQYTWIKTMLEGQILNWGGDRVDMAHSMESRPPFLDHHLAELAFTIPPQLRIKGNTEKYILREAMKGILPQVLYEREKFAFMAPPAHTDPTKMKLLEELIEQYANWDKLKSAGLLDAERVSNFFDEYRKDTDATVLVRKDALLNHILGVQILNHLFATPS